MLENLTGSLSQIIKRVRGHGRLTEDNVRSVAAELHATLLDADVALEVVDDFIGRVKAEAIGKKVVGSMNPGQAFLGVVHRQLTALMGDAHAPLNIKRPPSVVLACGLQGVGKTTNLAKIALHLKGKHKKRVLLAGMDIRRPAAIEQLQILAQQSALPCFHSDENQDVLRRCKEALRQAGQELFDVVLMDTAGRTTLDDEMMEEIRRLHEFLNPAETLFFIDAMQGQDAVNTARAFNETIPLSGIVVTKFDGDSRGGSVLAAKAVIGQPVKYVGVGEKPEDLERFHPDRFASRLLGMGDIASLAEQIEEKTDVRAMRQIGGKLRKKNADFNLQDYLQQIQQMKNMGGISSVLNKLPGNLSGKLRDSNLDESKQLGRTEAIIQSMTPEERKQPDLIKASRKRRIANGSATSVNDINQLLQQHSMMRKIMKKHARNPASMVRMMRQMFNA